MYYIAFENELGKINLNGGVWRIKDISGLGMADKDDTVISYPNTDGQELLSTSTLARVITMSGDILRQEKNSEELKRAIRILNRTGFLKLHSGTKQRKIRCRCTLFSAEPSERNAVYQQFVLQLTADSPYFEDFEKNTTSLFLREDMIKNSFTLPCVFTRRVCRVNVINSGDERTRPEIIVTCEKEGAAKNGYGIKLINHTTGETFSLLYKMKSSETICIDFENRSIKSSLPDSENNDGNLIYAMSEDSFLSEFHFETGINDIETQSLDSDCVIVAFAEYPNKYIEAVM